MLTALLIVVYAAGWLLCIRPPAQMMLEDTYKPDGFDLGMCLVFGAVVGALWPLWLGPALVYRRHGVDPLRAAIGETRSQKMARLESERREQEAHIRRLEREAGIV